MASRALGIAGVLAAAACQSANRAADASLTTGLNAIGDDPLPESSLDPIGGSEPRAEGLGTSRESLARDVERSALDLDRILANQGAGVEAVESPRGRAAARRAVAPAVPSLTSSPAEVVEEPGVPDAGLATLTEASPSAEAAPTPNDDEQTVAVASRLAAGLRVKSDPSKASGGKPLSDALALATLESLRPGFLAELGKGDSRVSAALSGEDRRTLLDARDRVAADPRAKAEAGESLANALRGLAPPPALSIANAALCSRVQGFARYDALSANTFVAGRPIRALVYTELEGFASRAARPGDPGMASADPPEHAVELSQSLSLYHDPSGLLAWQRSPQTVLEPSKTRRRDFFLVQRLELPATLSIGKYNLKVRVTDLTSGAEAEAIVGINVVADASLVRR